MEKALPFPDRVIDYVGTGLLIGTMCTPYLAYKGARSSPPGEMLSGAVAHLKGRGPGFVGGFALWAVSFGVLECSFERLRGVDDPVNRVLSAGITRGIFAAREGPRLAMLRAVQGSAIFGSFELASVAIDRYFDDDDREHRGLPPPPGKMMSFHRPSDTADEDPTLSDFQRTNIGQPGDPRLSERLTRTLRQVKLRASVPIQLRVPPPTDSHAALSVSDNQGTQDSRSGLPRSS